MKTWRYYILPKNGEGWAQIVLREDGFFAAVTDFGNYAYQWTHFGCRDFREFFLDVEDEWDYFVKKLHPETTVDDTASFTRLKKALFEQRREGSLTAEQAREAYDGLRLYSDWEEYLQSTTCAEHFEEPWDYTVRVPDPQTKRFVLEVMTQLRDRIRDELSGRKKTARTVLGIELVAKRDFHIPRKELEAFRDSVKRKPMSYLSEQWISECCDVRGDDLYPYRLVGLDTNIELLAMTFKAFHGSADIAVQWDDGDRTGFRIENHVVTERPVKLSL